MNSGKSYQGSCFCGAVQFTVSGEPAGMGYCHCESCRKKWAVPASVWRNSLFRLRVRLQTPRAGSPEKGSTLI